jgi:prepilin-type N-terminal cleavage/methylation domain-containing protein
MTRLREKQGFTLIELVLIITVIAIIAAVAIPRLTNLTGTKALATARKLQSDIAYAQNLAMTRNVRHRVYFNGAPAPVSGYAVTDQGGVVTADPARNGSNLSVTLNAGDYAGVTVSIVGFTTSYVEFNTLGVPFDGGGQLASAKSVTVSGGGATRTVTVQPMTGRVSSP